MYSFNNSSKFHNSSSNGSSTASSTANVWESFVTACSKTLGGFYRTDGAIFRDPKHSSHERDLDFADLVQRTHLRLRHQETMRQMNIEAITQKAYEFIEDSLPKREIDEDWVNLFFSYAQDISNPSMQDLWAKAMALEISQPGTISKHSLAYLRNCDTWELKAFSKVAASAFIAANGHPFIFKAKGHVSANDPIFSEHRLLAHCISAGLVDTTTTPLTAGFKFTYDGESLVVQQNPFSQGDSVGYFVQRFTRIGSDLYRIVMHADKTIHKAQKRLVWDYLTDYLELGVEENRVAS